MPVVMITRCAYAPITPVNIRIPNKVDMWFKNNEYYAYILFIIIWITGIAGAIISPAISGIYSLIMKLVFKVFGI